MMIGFFSSIMQLVLKLLPFFVKKAEDREIVAKKIKMELQKYGENAGTAADIREIEQEMDVDLGKKWEERWGKETEPKDTSEPKPPVEGKITITPTSSAKVGEAFWVTFSEPCPGMDLYADAYRLYTVNADVRQIIRLNTAGSRRIRLVKDGTERAFVVVEVRP